jgi:ionotropic glutamate receptor
MNPVSMEIWLCFSLAYFAVSVVLFLTSRVVNSGWRRRVIRRPSYRSYSYPKSVNDRRKSEIQSQRQKKGSNDESLHSSEVTATSTPKPSKISVRRRYHYRTRHHNPHPLNGRRDMTAEDDEKIKHKDVHLFGISNALFFSFASFMRQSINLVPKSCSGRVAATSWWYFSLIFISSYTANLVAFLTVEKLIAPIESVEDLGKIND